MRYENIVSFFRDCYLLLLGKKRREGKETTYRARDKEPFIQNVQDDWDEYHDREVEILRRIYDRDD